MEDVRYQIREGNTLEAIASSFGVTEEDVREINDPWITQPDEFRAGKALEIPETLRDVRTALHKLDLRDLKIVASEVIEQVEQTEPQEKSELTEQLFPVAAKEVRDYRLTITIVTTFSIGLILSLLALFAAAILIDAQREVIQYLLTAVTTTGGTLAGFVGGRGTV